MISVWFVILLLMVFIASVTFAFVWGMRIGKALQTPDIPMPTIPFIDQIQQSVKTRPVDEPRGMYE